MCRILWWVIRSHLIFKYSWLLCLEEKKKSSFHLCPMAFPTRALLSLLKLYLINVLVILNISTAAGAFVIIEVSGRVSHRWELLMGGIEVRAAGRVPPLPSARRTCDWWQRLCRSSPAGAASVHYHEPTAQHCLPGHVKGHCCAFLSTARTQWGYQRALEL